MLKALYKLVQWKCKSSRLEVLLFVCLSMSFSYTFSTPVMASATSRLERINLLKERHEELKRDAASLIEHANRLKESNTSSRRYVRRRISKLNGQARSRQEEADNVEKRYTSLLETHEELLAQEVTTSTNRAEPENRMESEAEAQRQSVLVGLGDIEFAAEQDRIQREQETAVTAESDRLESERAAEAQRQAVLVGLGDIEYAAEQDRIQREQEAAATADRERLENARAAEVQRQSVLVGLGDVEYAAEQDRIQREQEATATAQRERLENEREEEAQREASVQFGQQEYELEMQREADRQRQERVVAGSENEGLVEESTEQAENIVKNKYEHLLIRERASSDNSIDATDAIEPSTATEVSGPVAATEVLEPVAVTEVLEPVAVTEVLEPVAVTEVIEPVAVTETIEPVAVAEAVAPVASTSAGVEVSEDLEEDKVQYVILNCDTALNVRAQPSVGSNRLEDLSCQDALGRPTKTLILDSRDGFYKVFVNGEAGWISGEFTSEPIVVGSESGEESQDIYTRAQEGTLTCRSNLNRRAGPSTSFRILGKIPCRQPNGSGTKVRILGKHQTENWYIAEYNGQRTWVAGRYVNVQAPNLLLSLTTDIVDSLGDFQNSGNQTASCQPGAQQFGDSGCIVFDDEYYTHPDSSKSMAAAINEAKQSGTNAKKRKFLELFSPLALELQTLTGWPASVSLAQMALETNWGTSNVFRRLNNFGGHSCFSYNENGSRALRNSNLINSRLITSGSLPSAFTSSSGGTSLRSPCTYPRPRAEGGYYRQFSSVADAAFLYADNVLENNAYADAQSYVKGQFRAGQSVDPERVVRGLRAYAADTRYRSSLMATINANDLTRFDDKRTCQ